MDKRSVEAQLRHLLQRLELQLELLERDRQDHSTSTHEYHHELALRYRNISKLHDKIAYRLHRLELQMQQPEQVPQQTP